MVFEFIEIKVKRKISGTKYSRNATRAKQHDYFFENFSPDEKNRKKKKEKISTGVEMIVPSTSIVSTFRQLYKPEIYQTHSRFEWPLIKIAGRRALADASRPIKISGRGRECEREAGVATRIINASNLQRHAPLNRSFSDDTTTGNQDCSFHLCSNVRENWKKKTAQDRSRSFEFIAQILFRRVRESVGFFNCRLSINLSHDKIALMIILTQR